MTLRQVPFLFILLIVAVTGCAGKPPPSSGEPQIFSRVVEDIQPAVVTIRTFDAQGNPVGLGTGFFINPQGHLITNHHVLEGAYAASVKTHDGATHIVAHILADNQAVDLVKVAVDIPPTKIRWLEVDNASPIIAARVVVVGSPLGLEHTVSEGIVSAIRDAPGVGTVFQVSAPISKGSSGSPVVNADGRVIGVVTFQAQAGQNLNFAVASDNLLKLEDQPPQTSVAEWTYHQVKNKPQAVQNLCREGSALAIRGEYKEALKYFREAVENSPEDAEAWFGLGNCYVGLDQPGEAIAAYQQVIAQDPENANAHFVLGRYYLTLERYSEAVAAFEEAIGLKTDHILARYHMGLAYGQLGRHAEERRVYAELIDLAPDFLPAHFRMGIVCNKLGLYPQALAAQQAALQIKPDFAPSHYGLGLVYGNLGDRERETGAFKEALRINPDFAPAHYSMGLIYLENGKRDAALSQYKILKRLDEDIANQLFDQIYQH
ncbi:MAG: tetratricopeptide repeat protein [Desulfobacterales bacterium]|nr:tetratricopeptide repeat protein [Desulfobacterales bacterium]